MRLSFALFASAAAAQTISQVLSDIQLIVTDTQNLTAELKGPINAGTIDGVEISAVTLNGDTGDAAMDAKKITGAVSEADQVSVLMAIENLYPYVIQALAAYVPDKAKLDQLLGEGTPESLLGSIQSSADSLAQTLISKATGPYVAIGQQLQTDIDNAFKSALAGTIPTAVTLPTIPPAGGTTATTTSGPVSTSIVSPPPFTTTSGQSVYVTTSPSVYVTSTPPVYGSSSVPVYGSSSVPVYGSSSVPVYGSSSAPVYGSSSVPVYGSSSVPVYGSSSAPVYGSSSAPVYGSSSAPVYGSSSAPVYGSSSAPVYATTTVPPPSEGTAPAASSPLAPYFPGAAGHAVANMGAVALAAGLAIVL